MSVEVFDHRNISYAIAKEYARIENDAFRTDIIVRAFTTPKDNFSDEYLPSIADFEELRKRISVYSKFVERTARERYLWIRSDPRKRIFLMKNDGRYDAGALWILPKYLEHPKLSFWQRLQNFVLTKWFNIVDFFAFLRVDHPLRNGGLLEEFIWAGSQLGGEETPERLAELKSMDKKQLEETIYPTDQCYYLNFLCVRQDTQGKGYGRQILQESIKQLGPYKSPTEFDGPAKMSLFSAPTARQFYAKLGFAVGASLEHRLNSETVVPHTYVYKNLA